MAESGVLCVDCRHYKADSAGRRYAQCIRPTDDQGLFRLDLIDGKPPEYQTKFCGIERRFTGASSCGPEGKFFEGRNS